MSFEDKVKSLAEKSARVRGMLETEEATKNALIMPFIAALGYDVFDPSEVVPEFVADVGIKKGEKVDYAIKRGDDIVMLIEAKKVASDLAIEHSSQLFRYFTVTKARIAVLTNGIVYHFYSDLEESNKMDARPFLELNLLDLRESLLAEVNKLSKASFDLESMLQAASDLKYMREIRATFERQLEGPDEDFVKFFFQNASPNGRFTQAAKEQFARLVKRTLSGYIIDKVGDRLRSALARADGSEGGEVSTPPVAEADAASESEAAKDGIVTTEEELEGFRIVKAIVCDVVSLDRVSYRDSKSWFAIMLDGSNRKLLCRLHFNRAKKYVSTFDAQRTETRHPIESLDGIYSLREELRGAALRLSSDIVMPDEVEPEPKFES
jgi:hypothetical protein